jgi:uncharacterized protein (DUF433 family)
MDIGGAYSADRAAALSGVPRSTIHYWARKGHLVPSVAQQPRLWSFTDLLALRTIYWLRQPKKAFDVEVPSTSMPKVRRALEQLRRLKLDLFEKGRPVVGVTLSGKVTITTEAMPPQEAEGQLLKPWVDILDPFEGLEGMKGPDLRWPRPTLRIIPRKISGAPHVEGTRLTTQSVYALSERGYTAKDIAKIYPFASLVALNESIELEEQLNQNILLKSAA